MRATSAAPWTTTTSVPRNSAAFTNRSWKCIRRSTRTRPTFDLKVAAGHERKTTGSYYTHSSLVHCLLDSALDPILEAAAKKQNPEQAILNLKVCDPACGSGHFLIAAAHRMAKRLATVRTGDEEPSPEAIRQALRDVIGHCIYGVDINPMAVELCKVSLWMEALEPGKPLSFLDAHILCGNSLLGATPALLRKGIPDEAFEPIEGDDKRLCADYRKQNKRERAGQKSLFDVSGQPWDRLGDLPGSVGTLEAIDDSSIEGVHRKQQMYEQVVRSMGYLYGKFWADTWCAAFVWTKAKDEAIPYAITEEVFRNIEKNPHFAPPWLRKEVERLAAQYQFFHWHIAFPSVFRIPPQGEKPETDPAGWNGGFDVVVGNPPWDMVELSEKEFFASRDSHIAEAPTARQRQRLIQALAGTDPKLFSEFVAAKRGVYGTRHFVQCSGRFPYSSNGRINMYPLFTENAVALVADQGRGGIVVPSAISMDAYNAPLFKWLVESKRLYSLYDFDNTRALFPEVHRCYRFCLLTFTGVGSNRAQFNFCFYAHDVSDLRRSERIISLSLEQIVLFSPNTLAPPMFVNAMDAALAKRAYDLYGVLVNSRTKQNPWAIAIQRMLSLSDPGDMFR